eukprot:SAG22_NODE_389_length_11276_cov_12.397244_4_plen_171_part_00
MAAQVVADALAAAVAAAAQTAADALAQRAAEAAAHAAAAAAAAESGNATAAPPPSPPPRSPPVATVKSSVSFPIEIEAVAEGTAARAEFETGVKASLAAEIGGGAAFDPGDVVIDNITVSASRRRRQLGTSTRPVPTRRQMQAVGVDVAWHIDTPPSVMVRRLSERACRS